MLLYPRKLSHFLEIGEVEMTMTTTTITITKLKPYSLARKIDSIYVKIGHICCGQKIKDVEEDGGNRGQEPLISEYNLSFEKSFKSIPYLPSIRLQRMPPPWGPSGWS